MGITIWTIGHSNLSLENFIHELQENKIEVLADVRRFPGSAKFPHFNKENLLQELPAAGIKYVHFEALGGRRKPAVNSRNTAWRNEAFKGYADYMEKDEFKNAFADLLKTGKEKSTAIMCSEVLWWRCHRSLIADLLKSIGHKVLHILPGKIHEHPYTSAAKIIEGKLSYSGSQIEIFNSENSL
jgi:uncharacterized protein (DUF488 family)